MKKILLALILYSVTPVQAAPIVILDLKMAVNSLNSAVESGLFAIRSEEAAPSYAILDWIGESLASINICLQKDFRRDPKAAREYVAQTVDSVFTTTFRRDESLSELQIKLRREFLQHIKDMVMTEKFAVYTVYVEREWRAGTEARIIAKAQAAAFAATVTILSVVVARYFDVSSATAIWETVAGTTVVGGAALWAIYRYLPLTLRFRNPTNIVLKPVYDCTTQLIEATPIPPPPIQLSAGRLGRRRVPKRQPPRSRDAY